MNTDQIAAGAWEKCDHIKCDHVPQAGVCYDCLKSAIEAHASEQGESASVHIERSNKIKCKCGRDNRSDNTNCYHCGERLCHTPVSRAAHASEQEKWTVMDVVRLLAFEKRDGKGWQRVAAAHNATLQQSDDTKRLDWFARRVMACTMASDTPMPFHANWQHGIREAIDASMSQTKENE